MVLRTRIVWLKRAMLKDEGVFLRQPVNHDREGPLSRTFERTLKRYTPKCFLLHISFFSHLRSLHCSHSAIVGHQAPGGGDDALLEVGHLQRFCGRRAICHRPLNEVQQTLVAGFPFWPFSRLPAESIQE